MPFLLTGHTFNVKRSRDERLAAGVFEAAGSWDGRHEDDQGMRSTASFQPRETAGFFCCPSVGPHLPKSLANFRVPRVSTGSVNRCSFFILRFPVELGEPRTDMQDEPPPWAAEIIRRLDRIETALAAPKTSPVIMSRRDARAYSGKRSDRAFGRWIAKFHIQPCSHGRYSKAQLDIALAREAGSTRRAVK